MQKFEAYISYKSFQLRVHTVMCDLLYTIYTGWPPKSRIVDFSGFCCNQQLSFFTLLDRASYFRQDNALPPFSFKLLYSQLTGQELET